MDIQINEVSPRQAVLGQIEELDRHTTFILILTCN